MQHRLRVSKLTPGSWLSAVLAELRRSTNVDCCALHVCERVSRPPRSGDAWRSGECSLTLSPCESREERWRCLSGARPATRVSTSRTRCGASALLRLRAVRVADMWLSTEACSCTRRRALLAAAPHGSARSHLSPVPARLPSDGSTGSLFEVIARASRTRRSRGTSGRSSTSSSRFPFRLQFSHRSRK